MKLYGPLVLSALLSCLAPAARAQFQQQGPKLVGTGAVGFAGQGASVAVSADGNTALVGGLYDNQTGYGSGAAWVFTRSDGVWSQQGYKLSSGVGNSLQGQSVAL